MCGRTDERTDRRTDKTNLRLDVGAALVSWPLYIYIYTTLYGTRAGESWVGEFIFAKTLPAVLTV